MIYKATSDIEGNVYLDGPISINYEDLVFDFIVDNDLKLQKICIWKQIPEKDIWKYRNSFEKENGIFHLRVGGDIELEGRILHEFQLLAANLSFISRGALNKICWDSQKEEFIPQNEEEQKLVSVNGIRFSRGAPSQVKAHMNSKVIQHYVNKSHQYNNLYILKAFWNEGFSFQKKGLYIQAFYNYYFVIEGLYADGKTGEKQVMRKFISSCELLGVVNKACAEVLKKKNYRLILNNMIQEIGCEADEKGLLKLLFITRGRVHHFSNKSSKKTGTPFNQSEFEAVAIFSGYISCLAIGLQEVKLNKAGE